MAFVRLAGHDSVLWAPVDAPAIEAACRQALGADVRVLACEAVRHGKFNTSYRIGLAGHEPVILRVSPPARAPLFRHERGLLAREAAIHPRLATIGPVVPRILHRDFTCTILPRPYLILEYRPGAVWDEVAARVPPAANEALWRAYGAHVRQIHAISGECFGSPLPGEGDTSYPDWLIGLFDELAADLAERKLLVPGLTRFRGELHARRARLEPDGGPRLVHGDLWLRNVLVAERDGQWQISALLDAERAFWGEPAAEWIFSHLEMPRAFWDSYGTDLSPAGLHGDAQLRAFAYRARGALQLILECWRCGADAAFAHANFRAAAQAFAASQCSLPSTRGASKNGM